MALLLQSKQKLKKILNLTEHLAQLPNSAGIIDNANNEVLFRNPSSHRLFKQWQRQFKCEIVVNTGTTHNTQSTIRKVTKLKELTLPLQHCNDFLEKRYTLSFDGIGEILATDRFYYLQIGCKGCRIWMNQSWSYAAYVKLNTSQTCN